MRAVIPPMPRAHSSLEPHVLHLNHASTSPPTAATHAAMHAYLHLEAQIGPHRAAEQLEEELNDAAAAVARLLGVQPHQIAFVDSASRGWAQALSAVPGAVLDVFVSEREWAGNLVNLEGQGPRVRLRPLAVPASGRWCDALDAERVHHADGWLFIDASQAVGQMPVDATILGADVLVFPARKWLRGPRGMAVLVLSERALAAFGHPAVMDLHGSTLGPGGHGLHHAPGAARFQAHDVSPLLRLGVRQAALELLELGPAQVGDRIAARAAALRHGLRALVPHVELLPGSSGIVSLRLPGRDPAAVARSLWTMGVNVAVIDRHYAPLRLAPGESVLRLSMHATATEDDVAQAIDALQRALQAG